MYEAEAVGDDDGVTAPDIGVSLIDIKARNTLPARARFVSSQTACGRPGYAGEILFQGFNMWRRLLALLFGSPATPSHHPVGGTTSRFDISSGTTLEKKPWRTVGLTEQRLRARNRESWITSTKGWSDMLGRFSSK